MLSEQIDKKQFCPTLSDISDEHIKKVVNKLKGESDKETLANILEWQHRNIEYWKERWISAKFLFIWILVFVVLVILIVLKKLPFLLVFFLAVLFFGIPLFLLFYLLISYTNFYRNEKSLRKRIKKISKKILDTINLLGSVDPCKILEYKQAICRDYARFTASLLLNLYPEVYFAKFFSHVATGVKIDDTIYMIDQKLPICTLDKWLEVWNKEEITLYKLEKISKNGSIELKFSKVGQYPRNKTRNDYEEYLQKLECEINKMFGLNKPLKKGKPVKIKLKNFVQYWENDEIVQYSILRLLKNKIEAELCGNISRLAKIELVQLDKDLTLNIYLE
ncbi:hypothetical protein EP1X_09010 [Thermococcus sp. EP1]|uniref:transglutaminase-like domain-containing protein n=1 Tax=Thermococcus sp. EP1 TaxID=1591054 RepID=UPI0006DB415B|nr:transglutaminase-like domain-containing protein [Thermococcus sp. EP1]KPU62399.1 hypothetical protein EP1X_09010 [Thermococcus sp. EP1]